MTELELGRCLFELELGRCLLFEWRKLYKACIPSFRCLNDLLPPQSPYTLEHLVLVNKNEKYLINKNINFKK